jgi:CRP/FNR family transcriptional regulator, cyclic AMP receptor protein
MDELEQLRAVSLFSGLDDVELAAVRGEMKKCHFTPGQVIIREGEPGDSFHVITEGDVAFVTIDAAGKEIILDTAGTGEWFGELSMLTGDPRSARVKAAGTVSTLSIAREAFRKFLITHPEASLDVLAVIGRRLAAADNLLRNSASKNVNLMDEEKSGFGARIADSFAAVMGSWKFIIIQSALLAFWVTWNLLPVTTKWHWDEYPFIFLNLALSFQAAYAAPIIMMSQNRAAAKDRLAADIDHDVNIKAESQTGLILARLDDLEIGMHNTHEEHLAILNEIGARIPKGG